MSRCVLRLRACPELDGVPGAALQGSEPCFRAPDSQPHSGPRWLSPGLGLSSPSALLCEVAADYVGGRFGKLNLLRSPFPVTCGLPWAKATFWEVRERASVGQVLFSMGWEGTL